MLAKQLGMQFFDEKLNPIMAEWLKDSIFTIRESTVETIKQLIQIFGAQWAARFIIPTLMGLH
jgi:serine/threonine-protein phosphatase 2A regulatory subunit A